MSPTSQLSNLARMSGFFGRRHSLLDSVYRFVIHARTSRVCLSLVLCAVQERQDCRNVRPWPSAIPCDGIFCNPCDPGESFS